MLYRGCFVALQVQSTVLLISKHCLHFELVKEAGTGANKLWELFSYILLIVKKKKKIIKITQ